VSNKRINYACLALAYCDERPIDGVKSVGLSLSRSISNVYGRGSSTPAATYGQMPEIELNYSSHVTYTKGFPGFKNEVGLSDYVSFDMMIGSETGIYLATPIQTVRASYMLLSSVTYNLAVDGLFSIDRTFKGWNKSSNCGQGLGRLTASSGIILNRSAFESATSNLPSILSGSGVILQNIKVSMNINRSFVGEFATRKPYASYITFPIETSCTFDTIVANSLDQFSFDVLDTACKNGPLFTENIKIDTCGAGATIDIDQAQLTSFNYGGAEAQNGGGNMTLSLTYTGYQSPSGIEPVIYLDDKDLEDPCAC
jgi:hypothetical protein